MKFYCVFNIVRPILDKVQIGQFIQFWLKFGKDNVHKMYLLLKTFCENWLCKNHILLRSINEFTSVVFHIYCPILVIFV
jgi:hypothetical protein